MAKLTINERVAGANSGTEHLSKEINLDKIITSPTFAGLFPRNEKMVNIIADDIIINGYDKSQPIHIWKEQGTLIDGHHRYYATQIAGLTTIPVYEHSFENEEQALEYALKLQIERRNLNDAELFAAVRQLDALKKRGKKVFAVTENSTILDVTEEKFPNKCVIINTYRELMELLWKKIQRLVFL